jgi:beta-lactamase superfamily II metal-dependent hydrolase
MDTLKVRAYNVGFGDAILITVPDRSANGPTILRHILVDVGNVQAGEGGKDAYFEPVLSSIQKTLNGKPLDLYIMTHEHLDHVQGLFYGNTSLNPPISLTTRNAWLTASAEGDDYYERFPEAKRKRLALAEGYRQIGIFLKALNAAGGAIPLAVKSLMANNDHRSTEKCVNYLRRLAEEPPTYVYRNCQLNGRHPFEDAQFKIWAPEEDVSDYYGRFQPLTLGVNASASAGTTPALVTPKVPKGVDGESFRILLEKRRSGYFDGLLAIDRAANNTSVVFSLEWRAWKLLFAGDAEIRSWKTMGQKCQLEPVHFLKVSHHGSVNGTAGEDILEHILPRTPTDDRDRVAVVSSFPNTYHNVPDEETTQRLKNRGLAVFEVNKEVRPGGYVEIEFPADGGRIRKSAVEA